jgi:membrane-bound serine protease (ClpP class)
VEVRLMRNRENFCKAKIRSIGAVEIWKWKNATMRSTVPLSNSPHHQKSRWARRLAIIALGLLTSLGISGTSFAQKTSVVYVAPIEGMIDLGLAPFIQRVLKEATDEGAAAVILEINTFGSRVDAAVIIRDALLNARVPTVAFVNKRAISAGALIGLAAEKIVMAGGGTIGAATPVQ